jgi:Uma2 family endonuclease
LAIADVAVLPSDLPSGPVRYELDNGKLLIFPVPDGIRAGVVASFAAELKVQGERGGFGKSRCGEVAIILWRNPDRLVGADVVFYGNSSLPLRLSAEEYLETIPDLIVEVRTQYNGRPEINQKVNDYLAAGARVLGIADAATEIVTEYRPGQPARVYTINDTLTVEDIIPGFQMPVRQVFEI